MSELINKNKYLDFGGLSKYDALIKNFIATGNNELANAIAALDAKIGSLELEGSDDKNLSEIVSDIYSSIAEIVESQESEHASLEAADRDLSARIQKIVDDLEFITGSSSENEATLGEINAALKDVTSELDSVKSSIDEVGAAANEAKDAANAAAGVANEAKDTADAAATVANEAKDAADAAATVSNEAKDAANAATNVANEAKDAANAATNVANEAKDAANAATGVANEAKDAAEQAQSDAADAMSAIEVLNGEGEGSVKKIAEDAAAVAVASVVAGADSDFDTLKEVAEWIASDKEGAAALQVSVSKNAEDIVKLEEKVDGDIKNLADHMTDASAALGEFEGRIEALEAFEETHEAIAESDIEGLFA